MAKNVQPGTRVCIVKAYKNAKDVGKCGVILDEARIGADAGWDIYDIKLDAGRTTFAPGFNIRAAGKARRLRPIPRRRR